MSCLANNKFVIAKLPILSAQSQHFLNEVKPIIDNRCVVCHACYDAPCQLKMSSVEGIDRGANAKSTGLSRYAFNGIGLLLACLKMR
ncbi:hypothetical protein OH492_16720 [Vibrio chagasii]|nr:hypothetical protein [Vibrio chagasii]